MLKILFFLHQAYHFGAAHQEEHFLLFFYSILLVIQVAILGEGLIHFSTMIQILSNIYSRDIFWMKKYIEKQTMNFLLRHDWFEGRCKSKMNIAHSHHFSNFRLSGNNIILIWPWRDLFNYKLEASKELHLYHIAS